MPLTTIKDIRSALAKELQSLYDEREIASLSRIISKTIFGGAGLHHFYNPEHFLTEEQSTYATRIIKELKTGKPYQYVLGETEFYNCTFDVSPGVLIPRPETEELIDLIIRENRDFTGEIIDFGTGSGCIAITLAVNLRKAAITAIDNSPEALEIAAGNAKRNKAAVRFELNDILNFRSNPEYKAGIIVSNPPYVRRSEMVHMKSNVLDFEPASALFVGDSDPLIFYRSILEISETMLTEHGKVYFEINEAMGSGILKLMRESGFRETTIIKDLNNKDRFAKATR